MKLSTTIRLLACISISALFCSVGVGCRDGNTVAPVGDTVISSGTSGLPGQGSYYVYRGYQIDSAGVKTESAEETITVRHNIGSYEGKENVIELLNAGEVNYVHHEGNGDFSIFDFATGVWRTLPFVSPIPQPVASDTTVVNGNRVVIIWEKSHAGKRDITVGSEQISSYGLKEVQTIKVYDRTTVKDKTIIRQRRSTTYIWYSPKIGYLTQVTAEVEDLDGSGKVTARLGSMNSTLVRYLVK